MKEARCFLLANPFFKSIRRFLHTVCDEELTLYCDELKRFNSRSYPVSKLLNVHSIFLVE